MQRMSIVLIAVLVWMCTIATAFAAPSSPEARAKATAANERARAAEAEMRFAEAVKAYQEAADSDPSAPFAPGARVRSRWLERRSEGDFAPLTVLERFRRDPSAPADAARVAALAREAELFPPGLVRAEALLAVGEASKQLGDIPRALDSWRRLIEDESTPKGERVIALRATVEAHIEIGNWSAARETVLQWGEVAPTVREKTLKLYRRMLMTRTSCVLIAALIAAGAWALVRLGSTGGFASVRKAVSWVAIAFPAFLAIGGGGFAWFNEGHGMQPFLLLAAGLVPALISARACRLAFASTAARGAFALLGALAALGLAWLSMLGSPGLMEGFGL